MRKRISAYVALVAVWAASLVVCATAEAAGMPQALDIVVGSQQVIAKGLTLRRVAIGDPTVADVRILNGDKTHGVLVTGKSPGTTNLMLWERGTDTPLSYTVNVTTAGSRALLGPDAPNVKVIGDSALISGSASSMEQHQRAVAVAKIEAAQRAKSGGDAGSSGGKAGGGGLGALGSLVGGGSASGGGDTVYDTSTIATRSVVQVDVRVVEFSRQVLKQAGLNILKKAGGFTFGSFGPASLTSATFGTAQSGTLPPSSITTSTLTGPGTSAITSVSPLSSAFNLVFNSGSIAADLSLMEGTNLARVLAEPTLVALSGQSASFLAGGEIPIPVPQGLGTTSIQFKPYGIGLTLTPTVLSPQRIALKVAPEASQLDFTNALTINGVTVPALTTRRADTTVELGDGESFMIGGLIDRETISSVNKVPLLGDLPIIGAFFKQLSYSQNDKELVIIVTPHLVSPIAKGAALPTTPGEQSEQRDGPVWRSFIGGVFSRDAAPGFSK
ncbi:type II and III secretion system protein family protein [Paraburkholderia sp.]|uniref:type II and III secretion system protein family protein n=1 Tax=Paraburkholderia sp. TaxID=1926495 RepID=UPI003D6F2857